MKHSQVCAVMAVVFAIMAVGFDDPVTRILALVFLGLMALWATDERRRQ